MNGLNPKNILRKYFFFQIGKKKMFCHTFKFTQDYTEEIRNKTQISWFLLSVFAWSSRFCHFFYSFQSFLSAKESSKLSSVFEEKSYSAASYFVERCLPKSSEPQVDYYIDISSRSPQLIWERRLPYGSPVNIMLTVTDQNKCI